MNIYQEHPFIFSPRYRLQRHLLFWGVHILVATLIFLYPDQLLDQLFISTVWALLFIVYIYPILYWFIPHFLLKGKYTQFIGVMIFWGLAGWFWNYFCRSYIVFPLAKAINFPIGKNPWAPASFLTMNTMAGFASMIVLFKHWMIKQREYLISEKEKTHAELQLLKAQVHPHFLFNTLNNIYSFSLKHSAKTPDMILQLSSLLSYMLYDCKAAEVPLEKELEIMKNYINLEKERYGNKLEVSVNIEGSIRNKYIAPLLMLPFLENAFKHGTSEQLEKPWLNVDISVKQDMLHCKIVNSKNEMKITGQQGIGIDNVRKRLAYLYPGKHELKLSDEENFFVVSLLLHLNSHSISANKEMVRSNNPEEIVT
jgi:two-component system, LytTR family, sensor histidine kinase AlgZ